MRKIVLPEFQEYLRSKSFVSEKYIPYYAHWAIKKALSVQLKTKEKYMKDFHDLNVWEKSHNLTLKIYNSTLNFPREELYGLKSQIRRSCASIPTNIAEGCGRNSDAELARFLDISMDSASELEYLILLVKDLNMLSQSDYDKPYKCCH